MNQLRMDEESWTAAFHRDGYTVVRGCLDPATVEGFVAQISGLLKADGLRLDDPTAWPRDGARRVVEVSPAGADGAAPAGAWLPHWEALRAPGGKLAGALDALLGEGGWDLPFNARRRGDDMDGEWGAGALPPPAPVDPPAAAATATVAAPPPPFEPLHWYCPVVFPERACGGRGTGVSKGGAVKVAGGGRGGGSGEGGGRAKRGGGDDARKRRKAAVRAARECAAERKRARAQQSAAAAAAAATSALAADGGSPRAPATAADGSAAAAAAACDDDCGRRLLSCAWHEDPAAAGADADTDADADAVADPAAMHWQPVNRRRVRGKGWHIDWGPGFEKVGRGVRTLAGHPYQGVIVLLMLSDWVPGGGGTAVIPGSHEWVRARIQRAVDAGAGGVPQDELNEWCKARVRAESERGTLRLPRGGGQRERRTAEEGGVTLVAQAEGKAGDAVLLHPWLIHSGSTNYARAPRLMANGCARVRRETFEREGCRLLCRAPQS
eukprot:g1653.t1